MLNFELALCFFPEFLLFQLDAWGTDGETIQITIPSENEVSSLVLASEKNYKIKMGRTVIPKHFCPGINCQF